MLGLRTPRGKHAVVFTGYDREYRFINPVHEGGGEADGAWGVRAALPGTGKNTV